MQQLTSLIYTARCTESTREQRHSAFAQLIDLFQAALYARALRAIKDPQLAQDITQETLLTAYQQLPQLRQPEAFSAWLNQILRTRCNRLRRKHRVSLISLEMVEHTAIEGCDPATAIAAASIRESVLAAIKDLPEHERVVVHLFYLQEFSLKEIAERLKLPLNTIKKRLQYARVHLRARISETTETSLSRCQALGAQLALSLLAPRLGFFLPSAVLCPVLVSSRPVQGMIPPQFR